MVLTYIVFYGGGLDEMPAWALKPRLRVVCLASQQGGPWVPLRWLRRVLTEWRVVVLQGQWRGEGDLRRPCVTTAH